MVICWIWGGLELSNCRSLDNVLVGFIFLEKSTLLIGDVDDMRKSYTINSTGNVGSIFLLPQIQIQRHMGWLPHGLVSSRES